MSGNKKFHLHPSGFYLYIIFFSFYKVLPPTSREYLLNCRFRHFYFREKFHSKTLMFFRRHQKQSSGSVPKKFAKFTGKHLRRILFFNKVAVTLNKLCSLIHISMSRFKPEKSISGPAFFGFKLSGLFFKTGKRWSEIA